VPRPKLGAFPERWWKETISDQKGNNKKETGGLPIDRRVERPEKSDAQSKLSQAGAGKKKRTAC